MSHTYVRFLWSKGNDHEWVISKEDYLNKRYTYYYNGKAIKTIGNPYLNGYHYMTNISIIDGFHTIDWRTVKVNEIQTISDVRDSKLKEIGI